METVDIDFQIQDTGSLEKMILIDTSEWGPIGMKPSILEVTTPGRKDPVVLYHNKNQVTVLTSKNMMLNTHSTDPQNRTLPDGVYKIVLKGSPDNFYKERNYLRTTELKSQIDELLIDSYTDCENCEKSNIQIERLIRYKNLIVVAEAFIRNNQPREAHRIVQNLRDKLSKLKRCPECQHKV